MIIRSEVWSLYLLPALWPYSGPQRVSLNLRTEEGPLHLAVWDGQFMKKGLHLLRAIPFHCLEQWVVLAARCPVSTSKSLRGL